MTFDQEKIKEYRSFIIGLLDDNQEKLTAIGAREDLVLGVAATLGMLAMTVAVQEPGCPAETFKQLSGEALKQYNRGAEVARVCAQAISSSMEDVH